MAGREDGLHTVVAPYNHHKGAVGHRAVGACLAEIGNFSQPFVVVEYAPQLVELQGAAGGEQLGNIGGWK